MTTYKSLLRTIVACLMVYISAALLRGQQNAPARPAAEAVSPGVPPVLMSKHHEALCAVKVGDVMPAIRLAQLGGGGIELSKLYGRTATVVAFWRADQRMSRTMVADLQREVVALFGEKGISVVGVAVNQPADAATAALQKAEARFPNLLDADGKAFAQVGKERLPRVYLLDSQGKILWFDIEYSLATRRELNQTLRAVTANRSE